MLTVLMFLFICVLKRNESAGNIEIISMSSNITVDVFNDSEALFGTKLVINETLTGLIFAGNPLNGCTEALPHPIYPSPSSIPFIALVMRGNCSFFEKALAAERGNFAALIVFNDRDDNTFPMSSDSSISIGIPAIMVGLSAGTKIKRAYCFENNETFLVAIHPNPDVNISPFLIPLISIAILLILCTIAFCTFRVYARYRVRRRQCLTLAQLNTLPVIVFVKDERSDGTCAICLEEFADNDKLRLLPCHHVYHCKCIDQWLLGGRRVCPICKRPAYGRWRRRYHNLSGTSDIDYEDGDEAEDVDRVRPQGWTSAYGAVSGLDLSTNPGAPTVSEATETTPLLVGDTRDSEVDGNRRKSTWQWPWQKIACKRPTNSRLNSTSLLSEQRANRSQSSTAEPLETNTGAYNTATMYGSHSSPNLPDVEVTPSSRQLNMVQVIVHRTATPDDNVYSSL